MRQLINPPFDGRAPCPACVMFHGNGAFAYVHNFLNRCDVVAGRIREGKAWVKLNDLRNFARPAADMSSDHPVVQELIDAIRALVDASEGMVDEGLQIRWTPEVRERVEALIPRLAAAMDAFRPLEDAHRDDERHSCGGENILRARQGSTFPGFLTKADGRYDYKVIEVQGGPYDLRHDVCGRAYVIDEHFKERIRRDPTFYAKVWCKSCGINAPFRQFTCTVADQQAA